MNYFQPSFKLLNKTRIGAKVTKRYRLPATPCERLLDHEAVGVEVKNALREQRRRLDPAALLHTIREAQSALIAIARPETHPGVHRVPLEQFLSQLPDLWRLGEVRPTGSVAKFDLLGELSATAVARGQGMNDFKGRHFRGEIVLWAVRWYCRYAVSYRDLEAMMTERGVAVDHTTIYRWVQRFAPEMEKRLRWQWRRPGVGELAH